MNMIQKLKKNKKGFTLVELLVVLVILAILAAAIIPSMMGYINKARQQSYAAEQRNVLLASQVVLNEAYGKDATLVNSTDYLATAVKAGATTATLNLSKVAAVADMTLTEGMVITVKSYTGTDGLAHWYVSGVTGFKPTGSASAYTYSTTGTAPAITGTWAVATA